MESPDIFISFAHRDIEIARGVCEALEAAGRRCWISYRNVSPGRDYHHVILPALKSTRMLVQILTMAASGSRHVLREVSYADECNLPLLFFRPTAFLPQGDSPLAYFLKTSQLLSAQTPSPVESHYPRLVQAVNELLAVEAAKPPRGQRYGSCEILLNDDESPVVLGTSSLGTTYKAVDQRDPNRSLALKVLSHGILRDDLAREEFRRRAEAAGLLVHPCVAQVVDVGRAGDGLFFYATEYVEGESLHGRVARNGPLSLASAFHFLRQGALALEAAWKSGIIHGDVKPANLRLVIRDDSDAMPAVKLLDFGLAKGLGPSAREVMAETVASLAVDNPAFASPEKCADETVDIRSDLYSLGITVWYLLAGRPPFLGALGQVIMAHQFQPPPFDQLPKLPAEWSSLLSKLLTKDPANRPSDPTALLLEIDRLQSGHALVTMPLVTPPTLGLTEALPSSSTLLDPSHDDPRAFETLTLGHHFTEPRPREGASLASSLHDEAQSEFIPVRFGPFEIVRREDGNMFELGRGTMGVTYLAMDVNLQRRVALKILSPAYQDMAAAKQRFEDEARAPAKLSHPNVVAVHHLGEEAGQCYYAMEFIEGETVDSCLKRQGSMTAEAALEVVFQVAEALRATERIALVHRDIKPANLMLVRLDGDDDKFKVKVIDFGTLGFEGGFVGTPHFTSPEQLEELKLDVRSDIYSLGITLWHMLTGRPPFTGSLAKIMRDHLAQVPPFESLVGQCPAMIALLRRMLEKNPDSRPQGAVELQHEVAAVQRALGLGINPRSAKKGSG